VCAGTRVHRYTLIKQCGWNEWPSHAMAETAERIRVCIADSNAFLLVVVSSGGGAASSPTIRGLHSSTSRLNLSSFCGIRWVVSVVL